MRSYELLIESTTVLDDTNPTELASTIFHDCSNYFSMIGSAQHLYRGRKKNFETAFKSESLNNRMVKDSNWQLSELCDNEMARRGIKARRGNSIFTTGDGQFARQFGGVYEIFPENGFHYSWLKNRSEVIITVYNGLRDGYVKYSPAFMRAAENYIVQNDKSSGDYAFNTLVRNVSEMETHPRMLYMCEMPAELMDWFDNPMESLIFDYNKFAEHLGIVVDKDLVKALSSGHEIFINGKYYAVELGTDPGSHMETGAYRFYSAFNEALNTLRGIS